MNVRSRKMYLEASIIVSQIREMVRDRGFKAYEKSRCSQALLTYCRALPDCIDYGANGIYTQMLYIDSNFKMRGDQAKLVRAKLKAFLEKYDYVGMSMEA